MNKIISIALCLLMFSCQTGEENTSQKAENDAVGMDDFKQFTKIEAANSGLDFTNEIVENEQLNYFNFLHLYIGGSLGIGDLNNDGLPDVFMIGSMGKKQLFLNKGNLQFEDITLKSGIKDDDGFNLGVTMADVNGDGFLDIYLCKSGWFKDQNKKKNLLYINNGDLTFTEQAEIYGIADINNSVQSSFFDYDKDGDLDLFVVNTPVDFTLTRRLYKLSDVYKDEEFKKYHGDDKLYRNDGNNKFTDVSKEAGILPDIGFGLNVLTYDFNQDGWTDIFISDDFITPDYLYLNNQDGTFTEASEESFKHTAFYSMGADAGDINNDGALDLFVLDMMPADHKRSKTTMKMTNANKFFTSVEYGYNSQYMHNMLQVNNGDGTFREVSQMAGVGKTDWSWSALVADLDNDGWKDIFVANGIKKDVTDRDYEGIIQRKSQELNRKLSFQEIMDNIPSHKIPNYTFKNLGDYQFEDVSEKWGLAIPSFSNGAGLADLDLDGDLDLIVSNVNESCFLYENNAEKKATNNYLRLKLKGANDQFGLNTKVVLKDKNGKIIQSGELTTSRGFLSASEPILHFGMAANENISLVEIYWASGEVSLLENVKINQLLEVDYQKVEKKAKGAPTQPSGIFSEISSKISPPFIHKENKFDDYKKQILLPHSQSKGGPFTTVGDVNGDGLEDFYVGGAHRQGGQLYLQNASGNFVNKKVTAFENDKIHEDMGSLLFDADGDGDLDLYVTSGGAEFEAKNTYYQDRFYVNDGQGNFTKITDALPQIFASTSCITGSDYDKDGDIDLFVGGRVFPDHYPYPTQSYIFRNDGGKFTDVALQSGQNIALAGMVTSAIWTDIDTDGDDDLLIVGEWMPLKVFKNEAGAFVEATAEFGLTQTVGWWNKVVETDYDKDGDMDYVVGNLGLNHKFHASPEKPFHVYGSDFDKNGSVDVVLAKDYNNVQVPVRGRECSSEQMPFVAKKFPTFGQFADASISDILGAGIQQALHYQATMFESIILEKTSNGFVVKPLPRMAQIAPMNGIIAADFTGDGEQDILLAGNMYATEAETTRADASIGLLLKGKKGDALEPLTAQESGILLPYDVKDVTMINIGNSGNKGILVCSNNGMLRLLIQK